MLSEFVFCIDCGLLSSKVVLVFWNKFRFQTIRNCTQYFETFWIANILGLRIWKQKESTKIDSSFISIYPSIHPSILSLHLSFHNFQNVACVYFLKTKFQKHFLSTMVSLGWVPCADTIRILSQGHFHSHPRNSTPCLPNAVTLMISNFYARSWFQICSFLNFHKFSIFSNFVWKNSFYRKFCGFLGRRSARKARKGPQEAYHFNNHLFNIEKCFPQNNVFWIVVYFLQAPNAAVRAARSAPSAAAANARSPIKRFAWKRHPRHPGGLVRETAHPIAPESVDLLMGAVRGHTQIE